MGKNVSVFVGCVHLRTLCTHLWPPISAIPPHLSNLERDHKSCCAEEDHQVHLVGVGDICVGYGGMLEIFGDVLGRGVGGSGTYGDCLG